jgi:predicted enzyme related to lactoylglutathione lyase
MKLTGPSISEPCSLSPVFGGPVASVCGRRCDGQSEQEVAAVFQGLRTVIYAVADIEKAKAWYSEVLAKEPYFSEPFYVGFNVGGFELGLDPDTTGVAAGNNAVAYWGVPDAQAALARLVGLGAGEHRTIQDVGGGVLAGSVVDPFGNVLGIIQNPYFKLD